MKINRQSVILDIIKERDIETQNQLLAALAERGIKSTQATLSRDIKDMRLIKELSPNGNYRYSVTPKNENAEMDSRLKKIFREGVISYDTAQNLLVLKTLPGLASGACSALDAMHLPSMIGSIAGDDTAFIAMKDSESALMLYHEIEDLM